MSKDGRVESAEIRKFVGAASRVHFQPRQVETFDGLKHIEEMMNAAGDVNEEKSETQGKSTCAARLIEAAKQLDQIKGDSFKIDEAEFADFVRSSRDVNVPLEVEVEDLQAIAASMRDLDRLPINKVVPAGESACPQQ